MRPFYHRDPLRKVPKNTADLVNKFSRDADGVSADMLIGASITMLLAAMRRTYRSRAKAEERFNDLMGQAKQHLLDHYDPTTGKIKEHFALINPTTGQPLKLS